MRCPKAMCQKSGPGCGAVANHAASQQGRMHSWRYLSLNVSVPFTGASSPLTVSPL